MRFNRVSLGSGSPSVILNFSGQDLDLVLLGKGLHVALVASGLPDLTDDSGHDVAARLHDTHEFTESLGTNVRLRKSANTRHDIIRVILCGQGTRQVCHVQVAVCSSVAGLVEHSRTQVDTVKLLCAKTSEENTDEASATASVENLDVRADGGSS
ncbi:hypothetical protein HG531_005204 [Fusarium graminearum]|nr:hypothetical protein HG531_005204 [Fusarium graminearum]